MGEESIKKVLVNAGLTEKEAEVYIFLAKHYALKGGEIAKLLKKDRAHVFHILKRLQSKGFVETTLEFPTRFTAVPFEVVLDSNIKTKREEIAYIEKAKNDLLSYLKNRGQAGLEPSLQKFSVMEGSSKIYYKISQMIKETRNQLSAIATVPNLVHADQLGILEAAFNHPLRSAIQFRFLTELSSQNLNVAKALLKRKPKTRFSFKGRNPDLGLILFPRMVIRDDDEILFFITPNRETSTKKDDVCLWTNCTSLIQAFKAVFEDLWRNSTDIEKKIVEIENGKPTPETYIIKDPETAQKKYIDTMRSAETEIIVMTSPEGLIKYWKNMPFLKERAEKGIYTRIMAPITSENLQAAQELAKFGSVKHISTSYLATTIVDGKHLFQFKEPPSKQTKSKTMANFENAFYTSDSAYVEKARKMLKDIWESAQAPSAITLESILGRVGPTFALFKKMSAYPVIDPKPLGAITEKDVLNKIIHAKKYPVKNSSKDIDRMYATTGTAVIHPPEFFNLPDIMILVWHIEKQSSLGEEDALTILLWLETPKGYAYVPVAVVGDNPRAHNHWKTVYEGTPADKNVLLVKKDEIQIRVHSNTLFAGWTVPIPLFPPQYSLPPACLLIEGYGKVKTIAYTLVHHLGQKSAFEQNYFDAFVTFLHPSSKYSGPGTDGFFCRDVIITTTPASAQYGK